MGIAKHLTTTIKITNRFGLEEDVILKTTDNGHGRFISDMYRVHHESDGLESHFYESPTQRIFEHDEHPEINVLSAHSMALGELSMSIGVDAEVTRLFTP
ncbi:hypothetical protein ACTXM3_09345 [Glutamicibacter arilaitensis]|uniref:hypothetical protein n=1 Tax=Glutamicibacter arilaitensis TaxID=256701 RepID=UPI003FD584E2